MQLSWIVHLSLWWGLLEIDCTAWRCFVVLWACHPPLWTTRMANIKHSWHQLQWRKPRTAVSMLRRCCANLQAIWWKYGHHSNLRWNMGHLWVHLSVQSCNSHVLWNRTSLGLWGPLQVLQSTANYIVLMAKVCCLHRRRAMKVYTHELPRIIPYEFWKDAIVVEALWAGIEVTICYFDIRWRCQDTCEENPYDKVAIENHDCVGHVQKQMGSHLQKKKEGIYVEKRRWLA